MKTSDHSPYIKHVYWLSEAEEARLGLALSERGIRMRRAKGVVCTPLDPINKISSVSPAVWGQTCSRQGSWYRTSARNGLYVIISSFELEGHEDKKAATITLSDFVPPQRASLPEKGSMVRDPDFQKRVPAQWSKPEAVEKKLSLRWARRLGAEVENYESLHLTHTANHANFIKPRLFVEQKGKRVPYSIDRSALLCSSCLELLHVLGSPFSRMLVAPCPGATIFAGLTPDQYLLVERA